MKRQPDKYGELTFLLKSDSSEGGPKWKYQAICKAYDVSQLTVYNVRKKYIEGGLEGAILRKKPDRMYERRLDDEGKAYLIALACGEPPDGYERWSLRLLKDRIIRLEIAENISHETIRQTLKKQAQALVKDQGGNPHSHGLG